MKKITAMYPNRIWMFPEGRISKRLGIEYVCEAAGPRLDPKKMPKTMNDVSVRKWSFDSNGKRHLEVVK